MCRKFKQQFPLNGVIFIRSLCHLDRENNKKQICPFITTHTHKKMIKNILLAVAFCLLFITFASAQDTTLLVHKSIKENEAVVNTNVLFTITIYNVGQR